MYGTRDAGAVWEETYTAAPSCTFFHPDWKISLVVHGDDFTALGTDAALDLYERAMVAKFEVDLRGRLGFETQDQKEMKLLNRILRVTPEGLAYEADPRHMEVMAKTLGLQQCRRSGTPGNKDPNDQTAADGALDREDVAVH